MRLAPVGGSTFTHQRYGETVLRAWVLVALWAPTIAAVICGAVLGGTKIARAAGAASCRHFAGVTGYATNYQIQHFLDGGTCYVRLPNGHSLQMSQVVGYIKAGR